MNKDSFIAILLSLRWYLSLCESWSGYPWNCKVETCPLNTIFIVCQLNRTNSGRSILYFLPRHFTACVHYSCSIMHTMMSTHKPDQNNTTGQPFCPIFFTNIIYYCVWSALWCCSCCIIYKPLLVSVDYVVFKYVLLCTFKEYLRPSSLLKVHFAHIKRSKYVFCLLKNISNKLPAYL